MMNEISVISGEQSLNGEKIRYINFNNNNYSIYTLNEKDDEGYEKLYINKIVDNEEDTITDSEWDELKSNIPTIVKEIKNNTITSFKDLSLEDIKSCNLKYSKAFKLKVNIVDSIKKEEKELDIHSEINNLIKELNQQERTINQLDSFLDKVDRNIIERPANPNNRYEKEMEQLKEDLEKQKNENKILQEKITILQLQLSKYKKKIEQIKIMIDQS